MRKTPKRKQKSIEWTNADKIGALLDQLPGLLATANQAAEARTKDLKKWQKKQGLLSESSESDNW